nr:sulfotransferase [Rhabdothermincola salaria]
MSEGWDPGPRPHWVQAANRGDVAPITDEARLPLTRESLLGEARARLGLGPEAGVGAIDGDDRFLEPLDVVLKALDEEAELTVVGRWTTRRFLLRLLEVRFQLAAHVRVDPGVREEVVEAPIVVTGAPRTGTTALFGALAAEPGLRAPEGWELLRPVPSPDPDRFPDVARVALADEELRRLNAISSGLDAIHVYAGRMPKECLSAMSFAFLSEEFTARYHVPSYVAHLARADMAPAYEVHRLVLQVLQRRFGPVQWLLKSPVHLHSLDELFAVYPDARLVVTHRDPLKILPSVSSLVATLRWAHSDRVDLGEIGGYHAELYGRALDALAAAEGGGSLDPVRTHHAHHADIVADTVAAARGVHDGLGLPLPPEDEAAVVAAVAATPLGAHGEHRYAFADLGLDAVTERQRFGRYVEVFGVPVEDPAASPVPGASSR